MVSSKAWARRPWALHLPHKLLRHFDLARLIGGYPSYSSAYAKLLLPEFALSGPERRFVLSLLRQHPNFRLFRCGQSRFCGDFALVDLSRPCRTQRSVAFLELKLGAPALAVGPGHLQLREAQAATLDLLARTSILAPDCRIERYLGDGEALLELLCRRRDPPKKPVPARTLKAPRSAGGRPRLQRGERAPRKGHAS